MKAVLAAASLLFLAAPTLAQLVLDRLDTPLTGQSGNAEAGRLIVQDRGLSACLLCHAGPFPLPHLQGNIGPDLTGVGARLDRGQIRLRLVSSARINSATPMPSYFLTDGLSRVGRQWQGRTILTAQQIEDVAAFLSGLTMP
jgi:sulfur-oxidizing protein SoxX